MAFSTEFSDNFNRADGSGLGANWTAANGTANIVSNKAYGNTKTGYWIKQLWTANTPSTADSFAQAVMVKGASSLNQGLAVRCTSNGKYGYYCLFRETGPLDVNIYRAANQEDPATLLDSSNNLAYSVTAGDTFTFSATGTGATVTLKVYVNGTEIATADDVAAQRVVSAGYSGLFAYQEGGTWDDFAGGIVTADAPATFIPKVVLF